jgi:hypothetical protein
MNETLLALLLALWILALVFALLWCASCAFCCCCSARARHFISVTALTLIILAVLLTALFMNKLHALFVGSKSVVVHSYHLARYAASIKL